MASGSSFRHWLLLVAHLAVVAGSLRQASAAVLTLGNKTHGWVEVVSWQPRAIVLHGFLSHDECDHIVKYADPRLERSTVMKQDGSGSYVDSIRTSSGMFVKKRVDPVITAIEDRAALATHLHNDNQEDMQVLRYELSQEYRAHYDINDSKERIEAMQKQGVLGGLRTATLLMYLSEPEEGGETSFPYGKWIDEAAQAQPPYSDCGSKGVAVKPRKGDALLFFSLRPNGERKDPYSMHAGCPVVKGTKYSATFWIHVDAFGHGPVLQPKECKDDEAQCPTWAAAGECERNPVFMKGTQKDIGHCRLSCKVCRVCQPGDVLCERENERTM